MRAYERFIAYAKIHTASSEDFVKNPSTERQFDLARLLVRELKALGVQDARVSDACYVYGSLPATPGYEDKPKLGFIAHMDTIPDFSGENVKPTLVYDYDGGDIPLGDSGRVLSPKDFPVFSISRARPSSPPTAPPSWAATTRRAWRRS